MAAVFVILILLIATAPVLTITGSLFAAVWLLAIAAEALVLIVVTLPAAEFRRLERLWRPIVVVALLPCLWAVAQLVPVPEWLAHPAWASASVALGKSLAGTMTVDIGATVLFLGLYFPVLATAIIATAVALDRQRAKVILFVLTAAAAVTAAGLIGLDLGILHSAAFGLTAQRPQMLTIASIGLVLSCATALCEFERYRWHRTTRGRLEPSTTVAAIGSVAAMAVCLAALLIEQSPTLIFASAAGVLILLGVEVIHRLRLGPWGLSGIAAVATVVLIGLFATVPSTGASDLTVALSRQPRVSIATTERMLSDTKWFGTGAGTYAALVPIYRDVEEAASDTAPTAAASIALEMGRPLLWLFMIAALVATAGLLKRAVMRSREHVYPAAGAACIVVAFVSSFISAGILGLGASLLASAACGLALGQSRSWSS